MLPSSILKITLNSLSTVSCLCISSYLLSKERRKFLSSMLIGHVLVNSGIYSLTVLILAIAPYWPKSNLPNFICEFLRAILIFTKNANALWGAIIALTTYYIMIQHDLSWIEMNSLYYVYGIASLPTLTFFILFWNRVIFNPNGPQSCIWHWDSSSSDKWRDPIFTVCFSFFPLIACIAATIIYYYTIRRLKDLHRLTNSDLMQDQLKALHRRMYYLIGYPSIIFVTVLLSVLMYAVWHDIKSTTVQNVINWIFYSFVGVQGFIESLLYISNTYFTSRMKDKSSQQQLTKLKKSRLSSRSNDRSTNSTGSSRSKGKSKKRHKKNTKNSRMTSSNRRLLKKENGETEDTEQLHKDLLHDDYHNALQIQDNDVGRGYSDLSNDLMEEESDIMVNAGDFTSLDVQKTNEEIKKTLSIRDNLSTFV